MGLLAPLLLALPSPAGAQIVGPGLQQREQLREFQQELDPRRRALPEPPPVQVVPEPVAPGPARPSLQSVRIDRIVLEGNRAVAAALLLEPFDGLLGRELSEAQVFGAIEAATKVYQRLGYPVSRVFAPRGGLQNGVLRLEAVEGYIGSVVVTGQGGEATQDWVRRYLDPLVDRSADPQPITTARLQRQLMALRSVGGVTARALVTPAVGAATAEATAAHQLVIDLELKGFSAVAFANNDIQPAYGDWQAGLALETNVFGSQPVQLGLVGQDGLPFGETNINGAFRLVTPLGHHGLQALAYGAATYTGSETVALGAGNVFSTLGNSGFLGLGLRYPLILERDSPLLRGERAERGWDREARLHVGLALEGQNSLSDLYVNEGNIGSLQADRIRSVRLYLEGEQTYRSASDLRLLSRSLAGLEIVQGLPWLGADVSDVGNPSAVSDYTIAGLSVSTQQRLFQSNVYLRLAGVGQLSTDSLPSAEWFSYGGPEFGRAYRGVYLAGDSGVAVSTELSYQLQVGEPLAALFGGALLLSPFVFLDYAGTSFRDPLLEGASAGSWGLGTRLQWGSRSGVEVGWGIPYANSLGASLDGLANSIAYFSLTLGL